MINLFLILAQILLLGQSTPIFPKATDCRVAVNNLDPEVILVSDIDNQFLYPDPDVTSISIPENATVVIGCPGGDLTVNSIKTQTAIWATCNSGVEFTWEEETFNFNSLRCSRTPFHTARYSGNSCENNGREIEVGYIMTDDVFVQQYRICFDDVNLIALYSTYNLTRSIGHHESGVPRPNFIEDDFYNLGMRVDDIYGRSEQRATINGLLGLSSSSTKYIQNSGDYFLSRGHFTAKADFVYAPQQGATFHFVNVAPQWQTVNGFNWNQVEIDVRDYADTNGLDLVVYTGSYGVSSLPHEETGEEIPLYIYVDGNGNNALPVPDIYWKMVYNPATKEGVVLVSLNNPYQTDVERSVVCEDISASLSWLNWKPDDLEGGFSYACTVPDFRNTVDYFPDFEVTGVLL